MTNYRCACGETVSPGAFRDLELGEWLCGCGASNTFGTIRVYPATPIEEALLAVDPDMFVYSPWGAADVNGDVIHAHRMTENDDTLTIVKPLVEKGWSGEILDDPVPADRLADISRTGFRVLGRINNPGRVYFRPEESVFNNPVSSLQKSI